MTSQESSALLDIAFSVRGKIICLVQAEKKATRIGCPVPEICRLFSAKPAEAIVKAAYFAAVYHRGDTPENYARMSAQLHVLNQELGELLDDIRGAMQAFVEFEKSNLPLDAEGHRSDKIYRLYKGWKNSSRPT